jgi:hypothetical protein
LPLQTDAGVLVRAGVSRLIDFATTVSRWRKATTSGTGLAPIFETNS